MRSVVLLLLASCSLSSPEEAQPDAARMAEAEPEAKPEANPDAGEGARAVREEGKVGKKDAKMTKSSEIASNSGVLGALADADGISHSLDSSLTGGVGGLIHAKGTQVGAGGLGSRGMGLGGGGTAQGLGGLGTKGIGSGKSGYGKGGGSFGAKGVGGIQRIAPPPTSAEEYTNYGINNVTLTEQDRLSTFSIDVDTASYAISRSHLNSNTLPPTSAVRVEEFINGQTYGYVPPDGDTPFAVNMEASPSPWEAGHHVLRVGVKAAEPEIDRLPVHLTFLVDTSCSMRSGNKLPLAKRALTEMVNNLGPEDRVAIATYAGSTSVVLQPTRVSKRGEILSALENLRHGGGTAMGSGMTLAYDLALSTLEPGTENRVVVLSDGDANIGRTSHEQILSSLEGYAKRGITLSTIGFGRGNYKDTLMEQLANKGDGNYYYIDSFKEAQKVFGTHLSGTVQTVARDVKIQVDFDPASVLSYRLIGYENRDIADKDFRNDKVDAGEIGSGHTVTALYDVVLRDHPADTLATVRVRSKAPGPDVPAVERSTPLPTFAVHPSFEAASPDFRVAVGVSLFAEKLRHSPHVAEVSYSAIAAMVEGADRADDAELVGLIRKADQLTERQASLR